MQQTAGTAGSDNRAGGPIRDQARQAIAAGDQAAARELLHQLFVEETAAGLSASPTDAVVALASTESDVGARECYARTQRELDGFLAWLDTADLDAEDFDRIRRQVDGRIAQLEAAS